MAQDEVYGNVECSEHAQGGIFKIAFKNLFEDAQEYASCGARKDAFNNYAHD